MNIDLLAQPLCSEIISVAEKLRTNKNYPIVHLAAVGSVLSKQNNYQSDIDLVCVLNSSPTSKSSLSHKLPNSYHSSSLDTGVINKSYLLAHTKAKQPLHLQFQYISLNHYQFLLNENNLFFIQSAFSPIALIDGKWTFKLNHDKLLLNTHSCISKTLQKAQKTSRDALIKKSLITDLLTHQCNYLQTNFKNHCTISRLDSKFFCKQ